MVLGIPLPTYTLIHVLISLIAIATGLVAFRTLSARMTDVFLVTTILTSVTGFFFPNSHITPGIVIGIVSMVVLAVAVATRYFVPAERAYFISAAVALYLNIFVLVAQSFAKIPALHSIAPHGNEPAFLIGQVLVLIVFAGFAYNSWKRSRPAAAALAAASR
ncbi:MAG: hypothetical protein NVS9B15_11820 [Acidobacteriaceae bacterium]